MMLTIGQALDRAMHEETRIRIHVSGEWISGRVVNTDSQGVVVTADDGDVCVVRMDAITCLRLPGQPAAGRVPTQPTGGLGHVEDPFES